VAANGSGADPRERSGARMAGSQLTAHEAAKSDAEETYAGGGCATRALPALISVENARSLNDCRDDECEFGWAETQKAPFILNDL